MILETFFYKAIINSKSQNNTKSVKHWIKVAILSLLKLMTIMIAFYLAWECNKKSMIILRILNTLIALMFSDIYIIYYLIHRKIYGIKCYK